MAIKYISYDPNVLEGQAILDNFVRTQRILRYRDNGKVFERIQRGMPLYEVESREVVGKNPNHNLVLRGECLSACAYLKEKGVKVDLVYIDPPFASGADYAKKVYIRRNPKVAEAIIAGGVSTGFDVYNGEANYEKTLANFALAGIKAGKSTSQQLSIDAIYNGLTLANDKTKSDEEVKDLSISKIVGSVASISIDYGFKSNGIGKQVITNVIGNYTGNRVSETIKNNKKKDGGKID